MYAAVSKALTSASKPTGFNDFLFALARDNEAEVILDMLIEYPAFLLTLAKSALAYPEYDARWQIAAALGQLKGREADSLLSQFMQDDNEYVRRRAIDAHLD